MPDAEEGDWEVWAERMGGGGRSGVLVPLFGTSVGYELEPSSLSEVRSAQEKIKITHSGLWECDGFDVLHLSNTLKVRRQKNIKEKLYLDISGQNSEKTLLTFLMFVKCSLIANKCAETLHCISQ